MNNNSMYEWPDYYDWTSIGLDHDVTYYVELAKKAGGPVLELGCGTGRCTLAIAREGIPVVGVDLSTAMLERAKDKAKNLGLSHQIEWIHADMSQLEIADRFFPLVIIPYRSFAHLLTVNEQLNTLNRIQRCLTENGLLAFNIFVPHMDQLLEMDGKYSFRGTFPVPGTLEEVEVYDFTELDLFRQTAYVIRYLDHYDEHGKMLARIKTDMRIRYTFPTELCHLLERSGFKVENLYGTFYYTPFDHRSDELIVEARKKEEK